MQVNSILKERLKNSTNKIKLLERKNEKLHYKIKEQESLNIMQQQKINSLNEIISKNTEERNKCKKKELKYFIKIKKFNQTIIDLKSYFEDKILEEENFIDSQTKNILNEDVKYKSNSKEKDIFKNL